MTGSKSRSGLKKITAGTSVILPLEPGAGVMSWPVHHQREQPGAPGHQS